MKHGLVECPHAWPHSSFHRLVDEGRYPPDWCCRCERADGRPRRPAFIEPPEFAAIARGAGE